MNRRLYEDNITFTIISLSAIVIHFHLTYDGNTMHKHNTTRAGFTIVELLIVIVVIAILAAISVVAYTGIQLRARNAVTISATEQSIKLLQLYKATNGSYPWASWMACIGEYDDDVCMYTNNGANIEAPEVASFKTAIATVGTMPQPTTQKFPLLNGRLGGGIVYFAGLKPETLKYYLAGLNQECSAGGVASNQIATTVCVYELP